MTWEADLVKHCTNLTIGKHIEQKPEGGRGKYEAGLDSNSWVASAFPTLLSTALGTQKMLTLIWKYSK